MWMGNKLHECACESTKSDQINFQPTAAAASKVAAVATASAAQPQQHQQLSLRSGWAIVGSKPYHCFLVLTADRHS